MLPRAQVPSRETKLEMQPSHARQFPNVRSIRRKRRTTRFGSEISTPAMEINVCADIIVRTGNPKAPISDCEQVRAHEPSLRHNP